MGVDGNGPPCAAVAARLSRIVLTRTAKGVVSEMPTEENTATSSGEQVDILTHSNSAAAVTQEVVQLTQAVDGFGGKNQCLPCLLYITEPAEPAGFCCCCLFQGKHVYGL
jgi:hypothetical protein